MEIKLKGTSLKVDGILYKNDCNTNLAETVSIILHRDNNFEVDKSPMDLVKDILRNNSYAAAFLISIKDMISDNIIDIKNKEHIKYSSLLLYAIYDNILLSSILVYAYLLLSVYDNDINKCINHIKEKFLNSDFIIISDNKDEYTKEELQILREQTEYNVVNINGVRADMSVNLFDYIDYSPSREDEFAITETDILFIERAIGNIILLMNEIKYDLKKFDKKIKSFLGSLDKDHPVLLLNEFDPRNYINAVPHDESILDLIKNLEVTAVKKLSITGTAIRMKELCSDNNTLLENIEASLSSTFNDLIDIVSNATNNGNKPKESTPHKMN